MSWIEQIEAEEARHDPELQELYERSRDPKTGQVDNILTVHSLNPRGLEAHLALYESAMRPTASLRKLEREMIAVVVSALNECHY